MNKTEQRIAIAKWMGFDTSYVEFALKHFKDRDGYPEAIFTLARVPDYTRDLNAIHEVELRLTVGDQWALYYSHFVDEGGVKINATAAQRAEALLRTIGLWKEEA